MRFTIFQDSKVGDRSGNEDRVGYSFGKDVLLMVICDGMGGHEGGEVAAEIAVQEVTRRFQQEARNKLRKPFEFLVSSIQAAHRAIVAHADQHNMLECPRTTCVTRMSRSSTATARRNTGDPSDRSSTKSRCWSAAKRTGPFTMSSTSHARSGMRNRTTDVRPSASKAATSPDVRSRQRPS